MGQPKRRTSKSRKNIRRGAKVEVPVSIVKCKNCKGEKLTHRICPSCGKY